MTSESCCVESPCMDSQPVESTPIRVLLVDDHSIMREGLQSMLAGSEELEVVGQPGTVRKRCGPPPSCCPTSS